MIAVSGAETATTCKRDDTAWLDVVKALAEDFSRTAAERERAGVPPVEEFASLRDAGLLTIVESPLYGGAGYAWKDALALVRIISSANPSVGQLLGYHYVMSQTPGGYDASREDADLRRRAVRERWHWSGSGNPREPNLVLTPDGDGYRLNGRKSFSSGASIADMLSIFPDRDGRTVIVALPRRRDGVVAIDDWNHFGQRQSESGTIEFKDVRVDARDVLAELPPHEEQPAWMTTRIPMMQLTFVNVYLGAAIGALEEARNYIRTTTRPWQASNVQRATEDPYILEHFGLLKAELLAAEALADRAGETLHAALAKARALTHEERTAAAAEVYAAKVNTTRVALETSARVFDLMGARATSNIYGFDRFWRDIRTHSLHDPVVYKAREVGNYWLNGRITPVRGYT